MFAIYPWTNKFKLKLPLGLTLVFFSVKTVSTKGCSSWEKKNYRDWDHSGLKLYNLNLKYVKPKGLFPVAVFSNCHKIDRWKLSFTWWSPWVFDVWSLAGPGRNHSHRIFWTLEQWKWVLELNFWTLDSENEC